ncbi:MAG: PQQ-dependent sugar dehydrogenase [Thermoflexales bacterium]|nr:PQQ-dependent sugar dehydrogenase [Thermoflexales bacterium]
MARLGQITWSTCQSRVDTLSMDAMHNRLRRLSLLTLLAVSLGLAAPARARPPLDVLPPGFKAEVIVSGLELPTTFAFAPDGRIFIAEKAGRVKVWKDGVTYTRPLIDLTEEVNSFIDRGLIGMALDPKFAENGWIYLFYTWDAPGDEKDADGPRRGRLVRYTVMGDVADPESAFVLLDDHWTYTQNHSVGTIKFDRQGYLWASMGEGALSADPGELALKAQSIDNLQGKIIRIDPRTGEGVPGNPFFDPQNPKRARSRVWAYGFRNPFRFALHPETGLPYVGDVGWNTYESLMIATPGANFGWPCVEGPVDIPRFQNDPACRGVNAKTSTPKALTYHHNNQNASVTAGDFNTADHFPPEMKGNFFWGDYSTQKIWRTVLDAQGNFKETLVFAEQMGEPVDIQFGPDGALWYLSIYSRGLVRITYEGRPLRPLATITATKPAPGPEARILSPHDGDTYLGGQFIRLRGAARNATRVQWSVARNEAGKTSTVLQAEGLTAVLAMPRDLSDEGYLEAVFSATDAEGRTARQRIRLYPMPSDGYIRSWWLNGSYPWRTLDDDVLPGGEARYIPTPLDKRAWAIHTPSRNVDLKRYLAPSYRSVAYAFVWIVSPEERKGLLGMNSDDGIAAWLNGELIWRNKVSRFLPDDTRDIDLPPITLKKGYNALLIKVDNNEGEWRFKARVLNPDGSIMRDVVVKMVRP